MNTLNLARINELVPYEVWQTSEGDFNFHLDKTFKISAQKAIENRLTDIPEIRRVLGHENF